MTTTPTEPVDGGEPPGEPLFAPSTSATAQRAYARSRLLPVAGLVLLLAAGVFGWRLLAAHRPGADTPGTRAASGQADAPMSAGLDALYTKHDPATAVTLFQRVLAQNPEHYGATFQLARALDEAGRRGEAKAQWERALKLAEQIGDQQVVEIARKRLGGDPMAAGLAALYTKRDPAAAVLLFQQVLTQNPEHYGATYQLASALEQSGDLARAKPLWEKTLKMAEAIDDKPTIETARAHVADLAKRVAPPAPPDPDAQQMELGVDLLYAKHNAAGAALHFRKILAHNPEHYGANYQLATALDQMNMATEARLHWTKALKMAEAINDAKTAEAARARLARKP